MFKKLFLLAVVALVAGSVFISCKSGSADAKTNTDSTSVVKTSVAEFEKIAKNYVEKEISIQGMVSHTCKEGGKKMFLVDKNNDSASVKITTNETFDKSLEGSDVTVTGIVKEEVVNEAYLTTWENEIKAELKKTDKDLKKCEAEMKESDPYAQIKDLREQIKKSGTDHLSFYWLECKKYEVKK